jgi:phasin
MISFSSSSPVSPMAFEVPEPVRAFVDDGLAQARQQYARLKDAAEDSNTAIEAAFGVASKGASDYSAKVFGFLQANTFATFDLAQQLAGASSLSQAADVWQTHARKQFEALTSQSQELAALSRQVAMDAVEPVKESVAKLFKPAV